MGGFASGGSAADCVAMFGPGDWVAKVAADGALECNMSTTNTISMSGGGGSMGG